MELLARELKAYTSYKDTGEYYLGEIPSHWKTKKGKWLFVKKERPVNASDEIITCFRDGEVTLRKNRKTEGFTIALKEHGYQGIRKGDLVIHNMDAFAGAIGVSDSDGKSTPVYSVCAPYNPDEVDAYYYAYFLRNLARRGFIQSLAKGIRERSTDFRYYDFGLLFLPLPPKKEQMAITQFLNSKTALIDKAISIKERQIELLKERRDALINKAVTKGLNPKVKMKDSGVEWIGEIPVGWSICSIGYLAKIDTGGTPDRTRPSYWNGNIPWIKTGEVNYSIIMETEEFISEKGLRNSATRIAPPGTILMAMYGQGVTRGRVAILGISATYNQACCALQFNEKIINLYSYYFFMAAYPYIRSIGNETSQMNISSGYIRKLKIPIPSIKEQKEIATYLGQLIAITSKAIATKTDEIEKLKEYKSSLINSAVTGKIKVC
ncbi:MAG: restriction endonuclease subunit S [Chitinophagales bacterium]